MQRSKTLVETAYPNVLRKLLQVHDLNHDMFVGLYFGT